MTFELNHASNKAFLVPNNSTVTVKLRGDEETLENWTYRGLEDDRLFMLLSKDEKKRWIPVNSIAYIEQHT